MKYRIVTFNNDKKFKKVYIVDIDDIDSIERITCKENNYEIYKCNDKGNNYTHRMILKCFDNYIIIKNEKGV